eukprot:2087852-Karenia_brevis.AAC.1
MFATTPVGIPVSTVCQWEQNVKAEVHGGVHKTLAQSFPKQVCREEGRLSCKQKEGYHVRYVD